MYVTFVLPGGCNYHCPFCVIPWRGETNNVVLQSTDYRRFLWQLLLTRKVSNVSIQGEEPLMPTVWPLTRRLLTMATACGAYTSIVTNGSFLDAKIARSLRPICNEVVISLDAATVQNDKIRATERSFTRTVAGIVAAVTAMPTGAVKVSSILFPGKKERLADMPGLLAGLGVERWTIAPWYDPRRDGADKVGDQKQICTDSIELIEVAEAYGLQVDLSDELRNLQSATDLYDQLIDRVLHVDDLVIRLSPDGSLSVGSQVLDTTAGLPVWDRQWHAAAWVDQACDQAGLQRPERRWYTKFSPSV